APPAEVEAALADLDEAIRREPARGRDAALDHASRGRLLLGLDRHREALAACDAALAIAPDLASAHRDRAAALLELGRFAVRLAPDDPEGYGGRAAAEVRLRRHRDAAASAEESLRRREPTRERLYDAARTYAQAVAVAASEVVRRGRPALRESLAYESRAVE